MAKETETPKSHRDTVRERMGKNRPELDLDDEEAFYGAIGEDMDRMDTLDSENQRLTAENNEYQKQNQQFSDFVNAGEHNGEYFEAMMNGEDIFAAATRIHGREGLLEYLQSEEAQEKYKKDHEAYLERLKKDKELKGEMAKNLEETDNAINAAIEAGKFTADEAKEAISGLFEMADAMEINSCKPEWIEMWLKANKYDAAVDEAREEGRAEGVNEGINKQRSDKRKASQQQVNMPIGGGGAPAGKKKEGGGSLASQLFE